MMRSAFLRIACAYLVTLSCMGAAPAAVVVVPDNIEGDLKLTNAQIDYANWVRGSFDLASHLGVDISELQNYQILGGTARFEFMDDGEFTNTDTSIGQYSNIGTDPETGKTIYQRTEYWYFLGDNDEEAHYVWFGPVVNGYAWKRVQYGYPSYSGIVNTELLRDYPSPDWSGYDPQGIYYTERHTLWQGRYTGPGLAEFSITPEDIDKLLSQGYLDFKLQTGRIYRMGTGLLANDTIFKEGTLTLEIERIQSNSAPVANAGPDQNVERTDAAGAAVQLDGSASFDPDGDALTYDWTWDSGTASGIEPIVMLPPGPTTVLLTVSDGDASSTDTVDVLVQDTAAPLVEIITPQPDTAVQGTVTLLLEAFDHSDVVDVSFSVRQADGEDGIPIGYEQLTAGATATPMRWGLPFDTTVLADGYYVILARAIDEFGNEGASELVPFSVRNWTVVELLPASQSNKAGRMMPVKFSLRVDESADPAMPFVVNEGLEVRIYDSADSETILQTSVYGETFRNYRIDSVDELYITNFKTAKKPAEYVVEVWKQSESLLIASFTFETVK